MLKSTNRMTRAVLQIWFLLSFSILAQNASVSKPNIIFILADDLGWTDAGCYGSRYYETPNIDKLALQGMKFSNYHTNQNCAPTRAALMSGQYAPRTGIYMVGSAKAKGGDMQNLPLVAVENNNDLPLDKITIAQALKNKGYSTAMFGKWHLGNYEKNTSFHPSKRGFDEAIETHGSHFKFNTSPETARQSDDYLADWLTDKAVDFIQRNKEKPFFLYLPHFAVHSPIQAKKDLETRFSAKPSVGGHSNPAYAAMIYSLDESVGRIMKLLMDLNLEQNTIVIFSSDNGGVGGYDGPGGLIRLNEQLGNAKKAKVKGEGHITDNAPLRSGKGSFYEGGTRAPFIVKWPGKIKEGTVSDIPCIHVDLYPTLLEISGTEKPANYPLDGESLVPVFRDSGLLKREAIFQHFPAYLGAGSNQWRATPISTVISGEWKLMEFLEDHSIELYNLSHDIGEKHNVASQNPEKSKYLLDLLNQWRENIKAPMPKINLDKDKSKQMQNKKIKNKPENAIEASLSEDQ